MPITIKAENIICPRVGSLRTIEDWRKNNPAEDQGPWAVRCVDHDKRYFVANYEEAKSFAKAPFVCPTCGAYESGCSICGHNQAAFKKDPTKGFTPSIGVIQGTSVCAVHKYGEIPEGVFYVESHNPLIQSDEELTVSVYDQGNCNTPPMVVRWSSADQNYGVEYKVALGFATVDGADTFHTMLGFAIRIACKLNQRLHIKPRHRYDYFLGFLTHEEEKLRTEALQAFQYDEDEEQDRANQEDDAAEAGGGDV